MVKYLNRLLGYEEHSMWWVVPKGARWQVTKMNRLTGLACYLIIKVHLLTMNKNKRIMTTLATLVKKKQ